MFQIAGRVLGILLALTVAAAAFHRADAQESPPADVEVEAPQEQPREPFLSSPYLPLEHPAYTILEYWIAAGRITNLSPFVKPYRRIEVAQGLLELDLAELSDGERGWLDRLRLEFAVELGWLGESRGDNVGMSVELGAGATFYTQTHRDPLRPELEGEFAKSRLLEDIRIEVDGQAGVVAGAFRLWRQGIYRNDAQFPDGQVTEPREGLIVDDLSTRVEEGYLELQTRYARVFFGRMYRDWGAPWLDGFMRSSYAYSEEEIGYRVGTDRVFLTGMFASYPDFGADTAHYVSMHRLEIRPIDNLVVGISEASVHGGPGQNVDFRIVNPISIWQISGDERSTPFNKIGVIDAWWRATDDFTIYGSLLADATNREGSCCQMGGSFGVELPRVLSGWVLRANFSAIQSLAYRTVLPWEEYSVERIGLGWDKADLYLVTIEADGFPGPGLWVGPRLDVQVLGEGDFRDLRPDPIPDGFPRILVGRAEVTVRPALAGRWRSGTRFPVDLEWDVGINFITDAGHVAGDSRTELVGRIGGLVRTPRWTF